MLSESIDIRQVKESSYDRSIKYKLDLDHELEWTRSSGVDPGIVRLNVETLLDTALNPFEDTVFPIHDRLNWQIRRFGLEARAALRGWWVSGIDPLTWRRMDWGRFKPDSNTPIMDKVKGKPAKYLSPSGTKSRLVLLDVPSYIWKKISDRYNVPVTPTDLELGFWHWVCTKGLPVILTEGEKKAGCLLTLGYCAIALPGIFNGYRKDSGLIPELEVFATPGREFYICFDHETKPKTVQNVNIAIAKLGQLLASEKCPVRVIALPGPEKGVDDFILSQGTHAFDEAYLKASNLDYWEASLLRRLTYPVAIALNQRYLGELPFPTSGLACIKSPKGSGKTASLEPLIEEATRIGRKVIVLTHRVQLGRAICHRLGIDWVEDMRDSETRGLLGIGLCVDSLHAASRARFDPEQWRNAILILDEAEQVIWHALNSATCCEERVQILENLKQLVQTIISTNGLIVAQDADLSDVSVDYLRSLSLTSPFPPPLVVGLLKPSCQEDWGVLGEEMDNSRRSIEPWVVVNQWQDKAEGRTDIQSAWGNPGHDVLSQKAGGTGYTPSASTAYLYDTPNFSALLTRIDRLLAKGAVFVCLDSQKVKGTGSSINLESYFRRKRPQLRILRIDSQSVADPDHPAYSAIERLNELLPQYDLVLATPTIGTGVDINLKGHFIAVAGIFQGTIPDAEARQALARVRENVPRYIWANRFGHGKIGNGSCNYREVFLSKKKDVSLNVNRLLRQDFDIDRGCDPINLRTWALMAARVNASMWQYRQQMKLGLTQEGYRVTVVTEDIEQILPAADKQSIKQLFHLFSLKQIAAALSEDLKTGCLQYPGFEYLHKDHQESQITQSQQELTEVKNINERQEAEAVTNAPDITVSEYQNLRSQRSKTAKERHSERKHQLQQRYLVPITPDIKMRDDRGWYQQLKLHYYLLQDSQVVRNRDLKEWENQLERGLGKVALQDVRLLTSKVELLKVLGIPALLDPQREIRASDSDVRRLARLCWDHARDIKDIFNFTPSAKTTPIQIVQALLAKLGIKLKSTTRDKLPNGRRAGLFIYRYVPPDDCRGEIFKQWSHSLDTRDESSPP